MRCPFCGSDDTVVKDSRPSEDGANIRRRRACDRCGGRFTTFEYVQMSDLVVVKKNDVRVPFDRDKLLKSIRLAVSKREINSEKISMLVTRVTRRLEETGEPEVRSSDIGELVMRELFMLDKVAYVRYASVYKNFQETKDFEDFIRTLI